MKRLFLLLLCAVGTASAQEAAVTGVVRCHDTGRPCRFAGVELLPENGSQAPALPKESGIDAESIKNLAKALTESWSQAAALSAVADMDGRFSIDRVPPGTYYVIAELSGYVSAVSGLSRSERERADKRTLAAVESRATRVVVQAGQTSTVAIEMERGAVLSGSVAYSDGTAASGVTPILLVRSLDNSWQPVADVGSERAGGGDHGEFKFYGLPPGDYAVKAELPTTQALTGIGVARLSMHVAPGDALVVYSGGALRQSDLKPIHLTAGESHSVKIVFPLEGLHLISGRVIAASDRHPVNAGMVELEDPATKASLRTAFIARDGTFQMRYVPGGDYVLDVTSAGDTQGAASDLPCARTCREIRSYAPTSLSLPLQADAIGVELKVADAAGAPGQVPPE
jgi:hypothetical protein